LTGRPGSRRWCGAPMNRTSRCRSQAGALCVAVFLRCLPLAPMLVWQREVLVGTCSAQALDMMQRNAAARAARSRRLDSTAHDVAAATGATHTPGPASALAQIYCHALSTKAQAPTPLPPVPRAPPIPPRLRVTAPPHWDNRDLGANVSDPGGQVSRAARVTSGHAKLAAAARARRVHPPSRHDVATPTSHLNVRAPSYVPMASRVDRAGCACARC
jgi:hypothetical protein